MTDFHDYPFTFDVDAVRTILASDRHEENAVVDITAQEDRVAALRVAILDCGIMDPFNADNWLKTSAPNIQKLFRINNIELSCNLEILNHDKESYFDQCFPGYLSGLMHDEHFQRAKRDFSKENCLTIDCAFLLNHGHDHIYGHFISEIFSKIITVDIAYRMGFRFPVIIGHQSPSYCENLFRLILPNVEIIRAPINGVQINRCFLPSHPALYLMNKVQLHAFDRAIASSKRNDDERIRLLVRRSQIENSYREILNWNEVEELASNYGFTIFSPGEHSIEDQVDHFTRADIILGEYSSALHNSLFSGPAEVISLNWINHVQQAISYSRQQPLTIIMPEDGTAITAPTTTYNRPVPYRIKIASLKNALDYAVRNIMAA